MWSKRNKTSIIDIADIKLYYIGGDGINIANALLLYFF